LGRGAGLSSLQSDDGLAQRRIDRREQLQPICFKIRPQGQLLMASTRHRMKGNTMALSFPNQCRSYDARTHCIRFWAHDASFEVPFFIDADALCHIDPNATENETEMLSVFDLNLDRVRAAAGRAYARDRRGSYSLSVQDMK
jgi:hypothetical protein